MERRHVVLLGLLSVAAWNCRPARAPSEAAAAPAEGWSVTAWGATYEVFAETGGLSAGVPATSHVHVTVLDGFAPLKTGRVALVLRGRGAAEQRFEQRQPKREGIFAVELAPSGAGEFELSFRVESPAGVEELAAGRVRVGTRGAPGGLLAGGDGHEQGHEHGDEHGDEHGHEQDHAHADGVPFLKEQQWRAPFATAWVREGALAESVGGPGRVRPAGGGELLLTAPVEALVAPSPWPHVGLPVASGGTVFRLAPRVADRSLPELQADLAALDQEVDVARRRLARLTELLQVEGTSQAEVERAQATLLGLEARRASAREGVAAATGGSSGSGAGVSVRAPWPGRVAEVSVTPGQTVAAGAALGRLVRARPVWIVAALSPEDAARVQADPRALLLRRPRAASVLRVDGRAARLVARAPEVDPRTASVDVLLEVDRDAAELPLGSAVEVEVLLAGERRGIVVPLSALLDDGGTTVAYVQLEGESFARRELRVLARLGDEALVEGLRAGERLVTQGAGAVRRASLLSSGAPEQHPH